MAEWNELVEAAATETMAGPRCIQLSEKFDAPQFAREFLAIAGKAESRSLHIKAYCLKDIDPVTRKPRYHWTEEFKP